MPSAAQDEVLQAILEQRAAQKRREMAAPAMAGPPVDLPFSNRIAGAFEASEGMQEPSKALYHARNLRDQELSEGPGFWEEAASIPSRALGGAQKMWKMTGAAPRALYEDPLGTINRAGLVGQAATDAIVRGAVSPFTQFGRADIPPEQQAFDLASVLAGGGLATAGGRSGVGIFGGRLAKTANLDNLTIAEKMAAKGAPPERIWEETGWFKAPDGNWKFEIDDSAASLNEPIPMGGSGDVAPLGERLQHERAYEAYPDLKNIKSQVEMWEGGGGGAYGPDDTGTEALFASGRDPLSLKKTALHELQHAVQAREGFARGGNPGALIDDALMARKRWEDVEKPQAEKILKAEEDIYSEWLDNERINQGMPHGKAQVDAFRARYAQQFPENAARRNAAMDVLTKGPPKSRDIYERLAGETEARNVSTRSQWADKFRRADPPWKTQDVPTEQQIVRFRTEGPQASTKGLGDRLQSEGMKTIEIGGVKLPLNPDGTVTLYHGTTESGEAGIRSSGRLTSGAEPDVYLTTAREGTGYGNRSVPVRVDPKLLQIEDQFPDGRADFRMPSGSAAAIKR